MMARILLACFALLSSGWACAAQQSISHGRFKDVAMYAPRGEVKQFVLMLSGDAGWSGEMVELATALSEEGALVAGIDVTQLFANLERDGGDCVYPDGDLENLAHYIQAYYRLPTYLTPLVVGYSAGATLAYAVAAQAPKGTFAGVLSLGFCTDLELKKSLCKTNALSHAARKDGKGFDLQPAKQLSVPWISLHGEIDPVCPVAPARSFVAAVSNAQFVPLAKVGHDYTAAADWQRPYKSAYAKLGAAPTVRLPPPPKDLSGLPLIEVPAQGAGDTFAILLSGDGGWAGLDKEVAAALAKSGIPVAGWDSLRYFWTKRTPGGLAADLDRTIRYYAAHWNKKRVLLIGYSQGADVLPFAIPRLPAATRSAVALTALLGLSERAQFEFHISNWIRTSADGLPIAPEMAKLDAATLCIYGEDEKDSLCRKLKATKIRTHMLAGGHHFDGDYAVLAKVIIDAAKPRK